MTDEAHTRDRGGGIYVAGDFRLRDFSLTFDAETGEITNTSFVNEVRTDTFHHWLDIAERAAADAERARLVAVQADLGDHAAFTRGLEDEFRTSMVAVAAAAFAIDAFYASVLQHAPEIRVGSGTRDGAIFETLKRGFSLTTEQSTVLREQLRLIFRLRDDAVHPPATWAQPVLHPAFNVGMEPRLVKFRAENAINAQLFASKVIWLCLHKPKGQQTALVSWCEALRDVISEPPEPPKWAGGAG
jgi:hypothetical protein